MKRKGPADSWLELHVIRPIVRRITGAMAGYHKRLVKHLEQMKAEVLKELRGKEPAEDPESSKEGAGKAL